ncbi:diguanylate cyclase [Echinimonas agarilytica]|uniref:Diguanylate cyclase n=1 Tax=Echinimonas agarilytica TaxID=1215918 RepID=A0AA41W4M9_9GAMM|nr:diguanylate cyclase [Echinimonas agarilytica]MCM2678706.1 diguanylate cyclase [Echinimonas agarilytica]
MKISLKSISLLFCLGLSAHISAEEIVHNKISNQKDTYFLNLINLALEKAADQSHYQLTESASLMNQANLFEAVKGGDASILWAGTQPEYEDQMLPIRVPLLKGLQGHRLFIINRLQQANFSNIDSVSDLATLKAGQGRSWGDTSILQSSGLKVVTAVKKESLFYMVDGGRFDYFPLAVHEPWDEISDRSHLNLSVENDLLLIYPMPMYFFVSKSNPKLAKTLEAGLNSAIEDGSFDQLFYNTHHIKQALQKSQLANRRVIRIDNPQLDALTPLDRKELWLDVNKVIH